jgi:frataxin-like iron-binding protein CyaY
MNKEEFKAKANQTIDEISAKINELKVEKASVKAEVKTKIDKQISELKDNQTNLTTIIKEIENTSEQKWNELKDSFKTIQKNSSQALKDIESEIKVTA